MKHIGWRERLFKSTRGKILDLLRTRERTVNELAAELHLTDNAVRAHLASLERDRLVTGKMRSHSVISQVQLRRKFVHCSFSRSQKVENFSPGAFEQPLPPAYMFH